MINLVIISLVTVVAIAAVRIFGGYLKDSIVIEGGDQRSGKKDQRVQDKAHAHVKKENRGEIQIVRVLFLDQRIAQPAVDKHVQYAGKYEHDRNRSVNGGIEQACQDKGHDERDSLRTAAFQKTPEQIG